MLPASAEAQDRRLDRHQAGGGQRRSGKFPAEGEGEDRVQAVSDRLIKIRSELHKYDYNTQNCS